MKAPADSSIDEIELDIARTRVRLADTADALASELAPARLVREGFEMLNEFFGRPDAIKIGAWRADPVALGLLGLGIAWLVAENLGVLDGVIPGLGEHAPFPAEPAVTEPVQTSAAAAGQQTENGGWFHQAANATQGAFRSVYDRSGAVIGQASDFITHPTDSGQKVRQAGGRAIQAIEGSPLLLGIAGLAAGAGLAMLLPASRPEREIAAQAREEMWETAEEIGNRAAATVREMAEDLKEGLVQDRDGSERERRDSKP
jgi:Protein of unknown function (DUF3618)